MRCAAALGVSFYAAMRGNLAGLGAERAEFAGFDLGRISRALDAGATIDARHTVGLVDPITAADQRQRVNDGLPETLEQVVARYGQRYFKLKVGGRIERRRRAPARDRRGAGPHAQPYFVSLDGNEQYEDAAGVAALWSRCARRRRWRGCCGILFIEQPIARKSALDVDCAQLAPIKPVIIDESDGELDAFVRARELGYTRRLEQDLQGPLQVAAQRRALRRLERRGSAPRATSCRART